MAVASDLTTTVCNHCDRAIPSSNIDLHMAHCSRNLEKCKVCGDMIPKKYADEHFLSSHAPVSCSLCNETMDREVLDVHNGEICPQRIVTCEYCEFPLPSVDLYEHKAVCGNRTELCLSCNKYVRLHELDRHPSICNHGESSRDTRATGRNQNPRRRQPDDFSPKRLFFTIAITGIAVLLGSLLFQRKSQQNQVN